MKVYKFIYKITNKITGKFYIGKTTKSIQKRFQQHCSKADAGCKELKVDIDKYGKDNFTIEIIDLAVSKQELQNKERYWILRTNAIQNGYNKIIPHHIYDPRPYYFGLTDVYRFKARKS